jgi:hypothetical protein
MRLYLLVRPLCLALLVNVPFNKQRRQKNEGLIFFPNWIVSAVNIGLFMFVAESEYRRRLALLMLDFACLWVGVGSLAKV